MVSTLRQAARMSFEEFMAFYEAQTDDTRWELIDGYPQMMTPPLFAHQRVVRNLTSLLDAASLAQNADWEVVPGAGLHVPSQPDSAPIPDLIVRRGLAEHPDRYADDPVILFEVLSPSTERHDRQWKRSYYQKIETAQAYVIIDPARVHVELMQRSTAWKTQTVASRNAALELSPIGISVPVADIYRGVL